ncbi:MULTISPECIES: ergothioneine biosynthesis protein EgtB [Rhodococcus]|uniref:ergothioneine biosynthesis protein EgtB n=1 Tax=Rhodococcus TaxID=1827 RepID=UPI000299E15E|nr:MULTISPECIES: ergothioneine biosynthesis protein EgtB [Rhodococcus]ATQ31210.1 ergothioneine biosynthesis protein EgtB [Rhodococcus ruber]AWG98156.1 ergothioneine biosynthesis protein EgtB [Rhodococcus ruber]
MSGLHARLDRDLARARARVLALTDIDDAELTAQHSPLMSPLVWDLAHIANQEERWLLRAAGGHDGVRPDVDDLYDAFRHSRADRPALPLLGPRAARDYAAEVRAHTADVLARCRFDTDLTREGFVFAMSVQHEVQHAETMLATHQLRAGPPVLDAPPAPRRAEAPAAAEVLIPGGEFEMGTSTDPWALDNERSAHRVYVPAFAIDTVPVTNGRYLEFLADGGYARRELWSPQGWLHREQAGLEAPQFWTRDDAGTWWRRRFGVTVPLDPDEPVVHVCFHEAEAFARWAGRRLPSEAEWEKAARWDPLTGQSRRYPWGDEEPTEAHANLGQRHLEPAVVGAYPAGASRLGVHQLIGDVWEWTASGFEPYPGFAAFPYREYSEVFFGGDFRVLRGGSFGTDPAACRGTFRNWDLPIRRQIFAGFRCARDVPDV